MSLIDSVHLEEFLGAYGRSPDRIVFFVGAGLSHPVFPSWAALLRELVKYCSSLGKLSFDKEEVDKLIDDGEEYLFLAESCVKLMGPADFRRFIESNFDKDILSEDIPLAYQKLFSLAPSAILTSNYDRIPEIAGSGKYRVFTNRQTPEAARALEQGKKIVFKIHGDVLAQESIVLTSSDYDRIIFGDPAVSNFLRSILSTRTVLFLGFSLTDPHFDLVLRAIRAASSGMPITHFALLPQLPRIKAHSLESKYGIRLIAYHPSDHTHPEVNEFLERLAAARNTPSPIFGSEKEKANSAREACKILVGRIRENLGLTQLSALWDANAKAVILGVVSRAGTELELQNEIIAMAKQFSGLCGFIERAVLYLHGTAPTPLNVDLTYPVSIKLAFDVEHIESVVRGRVSPRVFWSTISASEIVMPLAAQRVETPISLSYIGVSQHG